MIEAYETETNFTVWSDISTNLAGLAILAQYTDYYPQFQAYIRKLFAKIYQKLGWDAKPNESKQLALSTPESPCIHLE